MLILNIGNIYIGLLKITGNACQSMAKQGRQGGYIQSGYTRAEVIKRLLDKIK